MNGLISYLSKSEVAVVRHDLFSPTTGGGGVAAASLRTPPMQSNAVRLCKQVSDQQSK